MIGSRELSIKSDLNSVKVAVTGLESPMEGESTQFYVTVTDPRGTAISGEAASLVVEIPSSSPTVAEEEGKYIVQYVPASFGDIEIQVSFDGKEVPGSPFHVYVKSNIAVTEISGIQKKIGGKIMERT